LRVGGITGLAGEFRLQAGSACLSGTLALALLEGGQNRGFVAGAGGLDRRLHGLDIGNALVLRVGHDGGGKFSCEPFYVARQARKIFGQNVNRLRNAARLTQEVLAEKADLSRRYIQEIESGEKAPTIIVLARLRKAFGCGWDELLAGL
jgi:DNA-binding XRE family transcriptional regulator